MIHTQFNPQKACSSRRKENHNSEKQHEDKERSSLCGRKQRKRLSSAALASVHWRALSNPGSTQYRITEPPYLGCYNMK